MQATTVTGPGHTATHRPVEERTAEGKTRISCAAAGCAAWDPWPCQSRREAQFLYKRHISQPLTHRLRPQVGIMELWGLHLIGVLPRSGQRFLIPGRHNPEVGIMHPVPLLFRIGEHLAQRGPEPQRAIPELDVACSPEGYSADLVEVQGNDG